MSIEYINKTDSVTSKQLHGFFVDWPNPPSPELHLNILKSSFSVWLAFDNNRCVGFVNSISDGIFHAYIPLLEVLPEYRSHGIGTELMTRILNDLKDMYAIDVVCDEPVIPFYQSMGFKKHSAMIKRNPNQLKTHNHLHNYVPRPSW